MPSVFVMRAPSGPLSISDTFDRSNTTTTIGTASDGGTWTQFSNAMHISSNQAAQSGADSVSRQIPGSSTDVTITIDNFRPSTAGSSQVFINGQLDNALDNGSACYYFEFDSGTSFGALHKVSGGVNTVLSSTFINSTAWTGGTATLTLSRVGALLTAQVNGVTRFQATDGSPLSAAFRWCGFRGQQTNERWDNFTATSAS